MVGLDELLSRSDYVSLHSPAIAATKHLINAQTIAKMKDGAVLINTARGQLVDEKALIAALQAGKLRAAGLDVFEVEPLPADSPLLGMSNVLLSGHIAVSTTNLTMERGSLPQTSFCSCMPESGPADCIQNLKGVTGWKW